MPEEIRASAVGFANSTLPYAGLLRNEATVSGSGFDGGLAIKTSPDDFVRLVEGGHAVPFDPSRKGRPMGGGWLVIGTDRTDE